MEDIIVKEAHSTKTRIVCSCCGHPFFINSHDKREPWCSSECRSRVVRNKRKPVQREKTVRELVDDYYDNGSSTFIDTITD